MRHAIIKSCGKQVACLLENSCKIVLLSFWKINKLSLKGLTFIFLKFDVILSLLQVSLAIFYTTMLNVTFTPAPFTANLLAPNTVLQFLCICIIKLFWSIKSHRVCLCAVMHSICNLLSAFLKPQFLTIVVASISYFVDKIQVINNDNNYCFQ